MERHLISSNATIVDALEALNRLSGETMTLFVVEDAEEGHPLLLGSLTDGDIRRALLAGHRLGDAVASVCHRGSLRLPAGAEGAARIIAEAREKKITLLPVVDTYGYILSLIDLRSQRGLVPAEAVLMAGGIGERLRPLTEKTPKPLLPVGGRPIIDHNIALLRSFGIERIYVAVNYLKEQIKDHLAHSGVEIIEEPEKLGTIGALSLLPPDTSPVVVMNADLLTDIDLESMFLRHIETEAWMTMAVVPYTVSVPFAIVEHTGDRITGLTEKPTYNYYANAGIYILRREALGLIKKGRTDATELADSLIKTDRTVTLFPIRGRWLDIGSPDDYRRACEMTERTMDGL